MSIKTITARLMAHSSMQARILRPEEYDWMKHQGPSITFQTTKGPVTVDRGEVYGVRPSSNGKQIRFVRSTGHGVNKVMTLNYDDAVKLGKVAKKVPKPKNL